MTDLTPERRAELRDRATSAKPFIGHDSITPPFTTIDAADLAALLDAADERDRLAAAVNALMSSATSRDGARVALIAAVERVRALHHPVGIFDECDCDDDAKAEGHEDILDVGTTCNRLYTICGECCADDGYQTEACADYHMHRADETHPCPTLRALDGADDE